jgi:hypothetical protein
LYGQVVGVDMTIGPGKYDAEATMVQKSTNAAGVVVIVFAGDRGGGFSVQATLDVVMVLPKLLRTMADEMEADLPPE